MMSIARLTTIGVFAVAVSIGAAGAIEGDYSSICSELSDLPTRNDIERRAASVAEDIGLDERLFDALIRTESDYQVCAVSPKGAKGLTQLMPATAKEMGLEGDIFDVDANLRAGASYLVQQISRTGTLANGLASYNAGPKRGSAAYATWPGETRDFVVKVLTRSGHLDPQGEISTPDARPVTADESSWFGGIGEAVSNSRRMSDVQS